MKKAFLLISAMILSFDVISESRATIVVSGDNCGENCHWEIDSSGNLSISGSGEWPEKNKPWAEYSESIKSVDINGFSSIGNGAFDCYYGGYKVNKVNISNSVKKIGSLAFYNCGLTSLELPDSISEIQSEAFRDNKLTSITIPESLTYIESDVFDGNPMKSIYVSDTIEYVHNDAINELSGVTVYCKGSISKCRDAFAEYNGDKVISDFIGYVCTGNGECHECESPAASCEWDGEKVVATSCVDGYLFVDNKCISEEKCETAEDGLTYCPEKLNNSCVLYAFDENDKVVSGVTCTGCDNGLDNSTCATKIYDDNGKVIAEYDDDEEPVVAYDYDDDGNLKSTYDDQCKVESCEGEYREQGNSCVSECGEGWRDMGNWCNKIRWTPAEAAAVLTDDNNNVVTITFKK